MHKKLFASLLPSIVFLTCLESISLAETYSKPGLGTKVTLFNGLFGKTATGAISGKYQSKSAVEGILFDAARSTPEPLGDSDVQTFNFVDTKGKERCYGSTSMSSGGINIWEVKGAVPGYGCSTVGKTYRFNFGR